MRSREQYENGLKLQTVKSSCTTPVLMTPTDLSNLDDFIARTFPEPETPKLAVFYLDYGIRFGKWQNRHLHFYKNETIKADDLQQARIFNPQCELRIWRTAGGFYCRVRRDGEGNDCEVIATQQALWGTHAQILDGEWTRLWEDRGTELILPLEIKEVPNYKGPLTWLQTVNYIGHLDNGQATYDDCRFVEILTVKTRGEERKT
jgi:CRISPR-associated protein (TIGR03984 family)